MKGRWIVAAFVVGIGLGAWLTWLNVDPEPEDPILALLRGDPTADPRRSERAQGPGAGVPAGETRREALGRAPLTAVRITARVCDRATNAPLVHARLTVAGEPDMEWSRSADGEGRVELACDGGTRDLRALALALRIEAPFYVARTEPLDLERVGPLDLVHVEPRDLVHVEHGATLDLGYLFLDREAGPGTRLAGRLVDERGAGVAGARLYLGEDPLYPLADARKCGRTDDEGAFVLDELLPHAVRHNAHHLFAVAGGRLAWKRILLPDDAAELDVGDLAFQRVTRLLVSIVDRAGRPQGGALVDARARFYPLGGLFDALQPGFTPEKELVELFRARADNFGHAWFDALPAPHDASLYELVAEVDGVGRGTVLLERAGAGPENEVVLTVQ